jgi:hypothetical protein
LNYNIIKENEIGIKTLGYSSPAINHNDLCDNSVYNFSNNTNWNQTCENNWWGTTSRSMIEQSIYDEDDNSSSGYVDYEPYLGCSIEDGGEGNFSFTSLGMIRFHF